MVNDSKKFKFHSNIIDGWLIFVEYYAFRIFTYRKVVKRKTLTKSYIISNMWQIKSETPLPRICHTFVRWKILILLRPPPLLWHMSLNPQVFYTCPNARSQSGHCNNEWPLLGGLFYITLISSLLIAGEYYSNPSFFLPLLSSLVHYSAL